MKRQVSFPAFVPQGAAFSLRDPVRSEGRGYFASRFCVQLRFSGNVTEAETNYMSAIRTNWSPDGRHGENDCFIVVDKARRKNPTLAGTRRPKVVETRPVAKKGMLFRKTKCLNVRLSSSFQPEVCPLKRPEVLSSREKEKEKQGQRED